MTTMYMQVICTFVFVAYILHVTGRKTSHGPSSVWILPGICIVLWALCSVDYFTNASFNPALAIAQTVFQYWWYPTNPQNVMTHYLLYYVGGAAIGGILAGIFYNFHETLFGEPVQVSDRHSQRSLSDSDLKSQSEYNNNKVN